MPISKDRWETCVLNAICLIFLPVLKVQPQLVNIVDVIFGFRSRSKNRSESESDHSPRTNWKPRLVDY